MEPTLADIRAALCLSRGGLEKLPAPDVRKLWQSLTDEQRRGYMGRYQALPKADRAAYLKALPTPPRTPKPPEPKPAGDEFAPLTQADDDTPGTHPDTPGPSPSSQPDRPDPGEADPSDG